MNTEAIRSTWPAELLQRWPGRFRYAELVRWLHSAEQEHDPAHHLLAGISAGRSVDQVLENFVADGEFQLAETLLAESAAVTKPLRAQLADLEPRRAQRASQLGTWLRSLSDRMRAAGLPFDVDPVQLEARARESWPAVVKILEGHEDQLRQAVERIGHDLIAAIPSDTPPRLRVTVESLVNAGRLTLARRVLGEESSDLLVPEAQPSLPAWPWKESAAEVLSWYVDPTRPRPPEFAAWLDLDGSAQALVETWEALGGGGQEAARDFAVALERFLNPEAPEPLLNEVDGGYLSTVSLFCGQPLSYFQLTPGVDLLILPPGRQSAPALPGVTHYLTVGPDLQPGGRFRTPAAVLTSSDILRLARLRTGRLIELARIAGRQWPLAALGVGNPASLARLFDQDEDHPWYRLAWLCHLIGGGGSAAAEDLLFQSGADAHVLYTLLTNLVAVGSGTTSDGAGVAGSGSRPRERTTAGLEGVVLRDCLDPAARAVFWAALMAAPPGTPVSLDSIIITAVLSPAGDDADWEPVLTRGFSALRRQWFVDGAETVGVRLRPIGALSALRSLAECRLAECGQELSGPVPDPQAAVPEFWSIQRYALSDGWPTYDQDRRTAERDASVLADLQRDPDTLVGAVRDLSGPCEVGAVVDAIIPRGRVAFPGADFRVEIPDGLRVAVPERALLTVLFELLENALEATERNGTISVSARVDGPDVLIDVMDDGPGLDESIARSAQVFRPGFSTRGPERGLGLNLARRVTDAVQGELEVANRSGGHPVFNGAHLTIILPGAATPKP